MAKKKTVGKGASTENRKARAAAAQSPARSHPRRKSAKLADERDDLGQRFSRTTAPRELDDDIRREKWGLPPLGKPNELGKYIIELNAQHRGGMYGAEMAFKTLFQQVISEQRPGSVKPAGDSLARIAKSYYRCDLREAEWRRLIAEDEQELVQDRAIYRLWPDFPVVAQTDQSMVTIKADAATRSFDATGDGITWAVIDSGIQADHGHFGSKECGKESHLLFASDVCDLHRSFADVVEKDGKREVNKGQLRSPDWDNELTVEQRTALLESHRAAALVDEYGHGTHVAGIIAGTAPGGAQTYERKFKISEDGKKVDQKFVERKIRPGGCIRGAALRTHLVSLRVLDKNGKGRASQIIQALEYIREKVNDNTKLLRVHGVNLSVGYEFDAEMFACGQSPLCTAVNRLVQEGVVVVTAAGNTGYGAIAASVGQSKVGLSNTINDPGNAALAITVGSTHRDSPHQYGVSYFSSKGPTGDGRLKPDLVAPGERITSCAAGAKLLQAIGGSVPEPGVAYYVDDSGTSMAAPHVSGAIAAFLSIRREFIGNPIEVKRIFLKGATSLNRERYFEGSGLLDLMRSIQLV